MRILIITQYFWPENFKINTLTIELKNNGHEVIVLTGLPNYPEGRIFKGYSFWKNNDEEWSGFKIYRSKLIPRFSGKGLFLFLNYISFAFFSAIKSLTLEKKPDLIFVYQPSPITVGIPALVASYKFKRVPIFFWVQDLWPDSLKDTATFNNRLLLSYADKLTRFLYKKSDLILVQSKAFIDYINKQGVPLRKIKYFPNPTEKFYDVVLSKKAEYSKYFPSGFNLIFAGNIGEAQSFDTLIDAAYKLKQLQYPIYWNILGDGRSKKHYVKKILELKLEGFFQFLGSFKSEEMPMFFACADALIVSLKKSKIFSLTIPAKVQSYLACGKPIIGSIDGEGAKIIEESRAGYTSPSEDSDNLVFNIIKLYNLTDLERATLGKNGRAYFEREFSMEILINQLENILTYKDE